jgi:hypothetical protein
VVSFHGEWEPLQCCTEQSRMTFKRSSLAFGVGISILAIGISKGLSDFARANLPSRPATPKSMMALSGRGDRQLAIAGTGRNRQSQIQSRPLPLPVRSHPVFNSSMKCKARTFHARFSLSENERFEAKKNPPVRAGRRFNRPSADRGSFSRKAEYVCRFERVPTQDHRCDRLGTSRPERGNRDNFAKAP